MATLNKLRSREKKLKDYLETDHWVIERLVDLLDTIINNPNSNEVSDAKKEARTAIKELRKNEEKRKARWLESSSFQEFMALSGESEEKHGIL